MAGDDRDYSFAEGLAEFYSGEIVGEAIYSGLLEHATEQSETLKLAHLLQLETETKAWLRPHLLAAGLSVAEPEATRLSARQFVEALRSLDWNGKMRMLVDVVPAQASLYQHYADAARTRGDTGQAAICDFMSEHELVQMEFARHELEGAAVEVSLEPLLRRSNYPLPTRI